MLLSVVAVACANGAYDASTAGSISIAITQAPVDVRCLVVDVVGTRTVERRFDVVTGSSTELKLNGLPLGAVLVSAAAFSNTCDAHTAADVAGWVGGPVDASLLAGTEARVVLPMRRNGRAELDADFIDDTCLVDGAICVADTQCCSQQCAPTTADASTCQSAATCTPDEGGGPCNSGLPGLCASGVLFCDGQSLVCEPPPAQLEVCNGLDDDCDGVIDDGNPGGGLSCNTGMPGACAFGTTMCSGGAVACVLPPAQPEICNGIDDDCDGVIDNNGACVCGDGVVSGLEGCDDGNTVSGDGCSSSCAVEAGFACTGSPSVCTAL